MMSCILRRADGTTPDVHEYATGTATFTDDLSSVTIAWDDGRTDRLRKIAGAPTSSASG